MTTGEPPIEFRAELINPRRSRELRRLVLRPNLTPADPLPGDEFTDAVHFGAFVNIFNLASTGFIYPNACPWWPEERPAWQLRSMATHPDFRGQGAGAAVLRAVLDYVAATGGGVLWCHARKAAVTFYLRHGFAIHGEEYLVTDLDPPIPHYDMGRRVEAVRLDESGQRLLEVGDEVGDSLDPDR